MVKATSVMTAREIRKNFSQYAAMILIAALAVALFTGLSASYLRLQKRADLVYRSGNLADLWITTSGLTAEDDEYFETLSKSENFSFERRVFTTVTLEGTSKSNAFAVVTEAQDPTISKSVSGFDPEKVMVDRRLADYIGIEEGENAKVLFEFSGLTVNLTLPDVAIVENPETVASTSTVKGELLITAQLFQQLIDDSVYAPFLGENPFTAFFPYNQIVIDTDRPEAVSSLADRYFSEKQVNNLLYTFDRETFPSAMTVQSDIDQGEKLCYVFPVIFFVVSVLVILTTCSQLIYRERSQIGTLKSLGYSDREIRKHYAAHASVVVLIGCLIGGIVGPLLIPSVMGAKYDLLYVLPQAAAPFPVFAMLTSILLFLAVTAIVSLSVVHKEIKLKPAESLLGARAVKTRIKPSKNRNVPVAVMLAVRNIALKKSRAAMVIVGIMGCTALLVSGFGIFDTLNYSVDTEVNRTMAFDVKASYDFDDESDYNALREKISAIEGVDHTDDYASATCAVYAETTVNTTLYIVDDASGILEGTVSENGATLTKQIAEDLSANVGDVLRLDVSGRRLELTVSDIEQTAFTAGIFLSRAYLQKIDKDYDPLPSVSLIFLKDGDEQTVKTEIEKLDGIVSVSTKTEFKDYADDIMSGITVITTTLKVFAILLAVVVLYNLIRLNFRERTVDIATMKVLGLNPFEIISSLILENMALVIVGTAIGLCLGYPIMALMLTINKTALMTYLFHINPISYVISAIITLITSAAINLLFSRMVGKISMTESLKGNV